MALPLSFQGVLEQRDEAAIEAAWLEHVADQPSDIDTFAQVAETLGNESQDLARELLELLDSELKQQELWNERLEMVRRVGRFYLKPGTIHQTVMASLEALYSERQDDLAVLMPAVGLGKGKSETPKMWDKVERLRNLLIYEIGTVVAMKDQGVGRVVDVNLQLQTLKVDFERAKGVSVGFRAAGKMLDLLDENHILRRKLEQPEELLKLTPPELLRRVLESHDRPLKGAEIRSVVHGLVPEKKWSSWWTAARKHPQVLASPDGKRTYTWASTSEAAGEHLWSEFEAADTRGQLNLLRRSGHLDSETLGRMVESLFDRLQEAAEKDPSMAFEIWTVLDRHADFDWHPSEMLAEIDDPVAFVTSIGPRPVRQRAYQLLRDDREDWPDLFARAFTAENDIRTVHWLDNAIAEQDPEQLVPIATQVFRRFRSHPTAFVYLAEKAAEDEGLRKLRPLRLLKQILSAIGEEKFKDYRARLLTLFESGKTLPRLLPHLREKEARDAEQALERARGLDDYQRKPLINALQLRFPSLRGSGDQPLYTTASSLSAKREELRALLEEEIPANRRAIQEAREMGDLRENFEYKAARQRHEYLSARASQLSQDLERTKLLEPSKIDPTEIRIGTRALLRNDQGERSLTILGPWESAPENGIVSFESELAQSLLGSKLGSRVEVEGASFEVAEITAFEDAS